MNNIFDFIQPSFNIILAKAQTDRCDYCDQEYSSVELEESPAGNKACPKCLKRMSLLSPESNIDVDR